MHHGRLPLPSLPLLSQFLVTSYRLPTPDYLPKWRFFCRIFHSTIHLYAFPSHEETQSDKRATLKPPTVSQPDENSQHARFG
ncbi:hypothetical protein KC19_4G205800 [Ceratodon purpureus]|uniref:Uncharacterized protein n=1 Tax=Ceratodon purpureus TaxID=3225 RepID=A0A8T0ID78_CERPU|nr:hypothetical protein KC19_4G205800 [Ceratodon purpureus]